MKKVVLISSFCDTDEKIEVLKKNIKIIKELDIDVILISPIFMSQDVTLLCDYYVQTKDNPVLDWPMKSMFSWNQIFLNGELYKMTRTYADYGWAGLFQVKQLSEFALTLNYDQFFHLIYDIKIDENVINNLKSDKVCNIFPSKRDNDIWKVGLHFMIFDRKNLERFVSYIHLDSYLSIEGADAFVWLHNLHKVFPYNFETIPVEDEIYFYSGYDFFNYSPHNNFSFFIVKDDELKESIKLLFYNVKENKTCRLKTNISEFDFLMTDFTLLDTTLFENSCENVELLFDGISYNITEKIKKIKHNTLRKC